MTTSMAGQLCGGDRSFRMLRKFACQPIDEYAYAKRELSAMGIEQRYGGAGWPVLRQNFDERARGEICCNVVVRDLNQAKTQPRSRHVRFGRRHRHGGRKWSIP